MLINAMVNYRHEATYSNHNFIVKVRIGLSVMADVMRHHCGIPSTPADRFSTLVHVHSLATCYSTLACMLFSCSLAAWKPQVQ
jgi:hypothetical protein